jgi:hypothetical protein
MYKSKYSSMILISQLGTYGMVSYWRIVASGVVIGVAKLRCEHYPRFMRWVFGLRT